MSVFTVTEFRHQTGSEHADAVLQEIIDQAEGEVNGWIELYAMDAVPDARFKRASAMLAKAGLYERRHLEGSIKGDSGGKYYNLDKKADQLRVAAKALIIADVATAEGAVIVDSSTHDHWVVKVNA
jgi:hypothetical protein